MVVDPSLDLRSVAGRYLSAVAAAVAQVDLSTLCAISEALRDGRSRGARVVAFGNGGSGTIADHLALSLSHDLEGRGATPCAAISLTTAAHLSAIANDQSPAAMFVNQLRYQLRPGDIVIAFSASGRSPNVLAALRHAFNNGATTIAVIGATELDAPTHLCLRLPCAEAAIAEDVFQVVTHALTSMLVERVAS